MFSWYKYLIVSLVFSHLGFWSGSLFLIAPFPDLCLLELFSFPRLSGAGMTSLTLFSTAEMSDDCVSKFASLVRSRD